MLRIYGWKHRPYDSICTRNRKMLRDEMGVAVVEKPCILHTIPGRIRVHMPGWSGQGKRALEAQLRQVIGIHSVEANVLTGNILFHFDITETNEQNILEMVQMLRLDTNIDTTGTTESEPAPPPVIRERQGEVMRARIPVRGLEHVHDISTRVVTNHKLHRG